MKHFYQSIPGWFNFEDVYSYAVDRYPDGSRFVEIGAWLGKSTAFMAVEIANSGKDITFDTVDTWEGSKGGRDEAMFDVKDAFEVFTWNMLPARDYVNAIKDTSENAAKRYEDASIDFVFIDGAHDYDSVKTDIQSWLPKIRRGGVIAGHDYNQADVKRAVDEVFQEVSAWSNSWVIYL